MKKIVLITFVVVLARCSSDSVQESYYPDGNIQWSVAVDDEGKRHGTLIEYWESGAIKAKSDYEHGKLSGNTIIYYKNGQIAEQGHFTNGIQDGEVTAYYENGNIKSKGNKINGLSHGRYTFYAENGVVTMIADMQNDSTKCFVKFGPDSTIVDYNMAFGDVNINAVLNHNGVIEIPLLCADYTKFFHCELQVFKNQEDFITDKVAFLVQPNKVDSSYRFILPAEVTPGNWMLFFKVAPKRGTQNIHMISVGKEIRVID